MEVSLFRRRRRTPAPGPPHDNYYPVLSGGRWVGVSTGSAGNEFQITAGLLTIDTAGAYTARVTGGLVRNMVS